MSLTFRWLGVAGTALNAGGQVLALDPFFTRPSIIQMLQTLSADPSLAAEKLPECQFVLVTHSHYDHLMDVAEVLRYTGAVAYGSKNTCQLLRLLGVPISQAHEIHQGDKLSLGIYEVEVIAGQHSWIPFGSIFNGSLQPGVHAPLRAQNYRMDVCMGYRITVMGSRLLVCAAEPQPADVLFAVAQESKGYYLRLFNGVQPHTFVPIHWDNFTRPLSKPLHRFTRPGRMSLWQLTRLARLTLPGINVIIPEIFREYTVGDRTGESVTTTQGIK
jgi:L-ascorbate metabolism protein UlaG (beta-lactamase superfamily)